jgi:hypothetical protein
VDDLARPSDTPGRTAAEPAATDAEPETPAAYLPLDIGLHVELDLAPGVAAASDAPATAPVGELSPPPENEPAELFFAAEDLARFLPVPPEDGVTEENPEEMPAPASPSLVSPAGRDDTPAPITLEVPVEDTPQRADDIVSEEDEPPPETLSDGESVETIETVALAEPDTLSRPPVGDEAEEGATDDAADGCPGEDAAGESPPSPALGGGAPQKKVFRRADLVLTAEAASIDPHVDPRAFQPWWFRPNARRAALAIAAAVVIAVVAMARAHHRAKIAADALGPDADTAAMNAPVAPAASTSADSAGTSDTATSPDSQPGGSSADSATSASGPAPEPSPEPTPDLRPPAPDPGDHGSDDGMARPAGPQSLAPIVPSGKSGAAAAKYPSGTFPRGYTP